MEGAATAGEHVCTVPCMSDLPLAPRWYCDVVNGVKGCCRNGRDCGDAGGVCITQGYVPCPGETFCCRKPFPLAIPVLRILTPLFFYFLPAADYQCYRDGNGSPQCRASGTTDTRTASGGGFSSTPRPTSTSVPGQLNSAVTSKNSFSLFGITPLLGWIGESFESSYFTVMIS